MKKIGTHKKRKNRRKGSSSSFSQFMISFKGALRIIGIALLFGSSLFALTLGIEQIGDLSVFRVKEIHWLGLKHHKEAEMDKRFRSVFGKNLFKVDIKEIHRRLLSNQWIKAATVKKAFPDRLLVIIVERKPASVEYESGLKAGEFVNLSAAPTLLDQNGVTLQQGGPYPPDLPRLINVNQKAYAGALRVGKIVKNRSGIFLDLSDPDDLLLVFTGPSGKQQLGRLHLGKKHYQEKWRRFLIIETNLAQRGLSQWEIDLRIPERAVVKTLGTTINPELLYF